MELELRDYAQIILRRKWMIVAIVLLSSVAAGLFSIFMIKPTYQATTKIVVNRTTTTTNAVENGFNPSEVTVNLQLIATYKEIIKTPAIMETVAKEHPEFNLTADELVNKVKVSSVNNTQVMTLAVSDLSYATAAEIVNAISLEFKKQIPSIFNIQNVTILNLAEISPVKEPIPINKNVKLTFIAAFVLSLAIAIGIAFLLEYMDDTIKTEADVRRILDLPTIGQISRMDNDGLKDSDAVKAQKLKAGDINVQVSK